jgi:hypothetical protein
MREILALIVSLTALLPSGASYSQTPPVAASADQVAAIRRLLSSTFEKPETRLLLDPIVVEENAALVGWIQGDLAGRAFLRDRDGHWVITACGGDALKDASTLQRLGLSQVHADRLAGAMAAAEAKIDRQRVARFATFGELVEMGSEAHSPANPHRH